MVASTWIISLNFNNSNISLKQETYIFNVLFSSGKKQVSLFSSLETKSFYAKHLGSQKPLVRLE